MGIRHLLNVSNSSLGSESVKGKMRNKSTWYDTNVASYTNVSNIFFSKTYKSPQQGKHHRTVLNEGRF